MRHAPALLAAMAFLYLAPQYGIALFTPATGIYHDDALYLLTAKSLASGHGYTIESLPTAIPQTKYPILFPALLSLVWMSFPDFPANLPLFKLVPLLAAIGWFIASYRLLRLLSLPALPATAAIVLLAASPQVVFLSTAVLSETTFALLLTLCLIQAIRLPQTPSWQQLATVSMLAAAAYHTRSIGIGLIGGLALTLLAKRQWRQALIFSATTIALCLPWPLWQWWHRQHADPYLSSANYYSGYNVLSNFSFPEKLQIIGKNLLFLPFSVQPILDLPIGGLIGLLCLPFVLRSLLRGAIPNAIRFPLLASMGLIILWAWPPLRFLIPLLPLALGAFLLGVPPRWQTRATLCVIILAIFAAARTTHYTREAVSTGLWLPLPVPPQSWTAFSSQLQWIRANCPADAILQSNVDPTVYLYTGRRAIRGSHRNASLLWYLDSSQPLGPVSEFASQLRQNRVNYLVETPWPWFFESEHFYRLRQQLPSSLLRPVFSSSESGFTIFETRFPSPSP